jgi:hypothetical protein
MPAQSEGPLVRPFQLHRQAAAHLRIRRQKRHARVRQLQLPARWQQRHSRKPRRPEPPEPRRPEPPEPRRPPETPCAPRAQRWISACGPRWISSSDQCSSPETSLRRWACVRQGGRCPPPPQPVLHLPCSAPVLCRGRFGLRAPSHPQNRRRDASVRGSSASWLWAARCPATSRVLPQSRPCRRWRRTQRTQSGCRAHPGCRRPPPCRGASCGRRSCWIRRAAPRWTPSCRIRPTPGQSRPSRGARTPRSVALEALWMRARYSRPWWVRRPTRPRRTRPRRCLHANCAQLFPQSLRRIRRFAAPTPPKTWPSPRAAQWISEPPSPLPRPPHPPYRHSRALPPRPPSKQHCFREASRRKEGWRSLR